MADDRRLAELTVAESLLLPGSIPVGRVVFTHHALPAIRLAPASRLPDLYGSGTGCHEVTARSGAGQ